MRTESLTDGGAIFEQAWRDNRPFLVDLAFRMLGNIGDAEDVVQDAFARLLRADMETIGDYRGWLVVVVSRLCLDVLRSARVRRAGPPPTDAAGDGRTTLLGDPDPADRVTLDDHVRIALLVVLEELTPPERAVFVLHDVFRFPFDEIATITGRSVDACRKLASRARHRVEAAGGPSRFAVEPAEHRRIAERFIDACAGGDLAALLNMLDTEVIGQADLGAGAEPVPIQAGRDRVASNILRFFGTSDVTLVSQPIDGWPGVLAFKDGRLWAVVQLETQAGLVHEIHAVLNPRALVPLSELVDAQRS
jgi:RNA polymerase sigma-70 factor (ECF subfamily)